MTTVNRMLVLVLFSVALLIGTAGVTYAQAPAQGAAPLRVAIAVDNAKELHTFLVRMVVNGVRNGLRGGMSKAAVKVVDIDEPADFIVTVSWRTITLPGRKPRDKPLVILDRLSTTVDGRELIERSSSPSPWEFASHALGRDVATILKLRGAPVTTRETDAAQLDLLTQGLSARDALERTRFVARIAALGPAGAGAANALAGMLGDARPLRIVGPGTATSVGAEAAKALMAVGAAPTLVQALKTASDDKVRVTALSALAKAYWLSGSDVLAALSDPSAKVRQVAARYARLAGPKAIPSLIDILVQKNDRETRNAARDSLVKLTDQDFALDGKQWHAWWAAAKDRK